MPRVELGTVNHLPWFSLTRVPSLPPQPPQAGALLGASSLRICGAPPAGLENSNITRIWSPIDLAVHTEAAGVHTVPSRPRDN